MLDKKDEFINNVRQTKEIIARALDKARSDIFNDPSDYNEGLKYGFGYALELLNIDFDDFEK